MEGKSKVQAQTLESKCFESDPDIVQGSPSTLLEVDFAGGSLSWSPAVNVAPERRVVTARATTPTPQSSAVMGA
eukprot:4047000-Amphidinium_carterae.1